MSPAQSDPHLGSRRHVRACREQTWGVCPPLPDWLCVPVLGDGYHLRLTDARFRPDTMIGGWKRTIHLSHYRQLSGRWLVELHPSLTEFLLEVLLDRTVTDLPSYCIDYYTPSDPRRHLGCVAERGVLVAEAGHPARLILSMRGRNETANASLAESDFNYADLTPVPFCLHHAEVLLDGDPVTDVESFVLTVNNNLVSGPNIGGTVAWFLAAQRAVGLELVSLDDSDTFNVAVRDGGTLSFSAEFSHAEGHSLSLSLPVLYVETNRERAPTEALARSLPVTEVGVDESGNDIAWSVTLN